MESPRSILAPSGRGAGGDSSRPLSDLLEWARLSRETALHDVVELPWVRPLYHSTLKLQSGAVMRSRNESSLRRHPVGSHDVNDPQDLRSRSDLGLYPLGDLVLGDGEGQGLGGQL